MVVTVLMMMVVTLATIWCQYFATVILTWVTCDVGDKNVYLCNKLGDDSRLYSLVQVRHNNLNKQMMMILMMVMTLIYVDYDYDYDYLTITSV